MTLFYVPSHGMSSVPSSCLAPTTIVQGLPEQGAPI